MTKKEVKRKLSPQFRLRIKPDLEKSALCTFMGISRPTLDRKLRNPNKFSKSEILALEKFSGMKEKEIFETETE